MLKRVDTATCTKCDRNKLWMGHIMFQLAHQVLVTLSHLETTSQQQDIWVSSHILAMFRLVYSQVTTPRDTSHQHTLLGDMGSQLQHSQ